MIRGYYYSDSKENIVIVPYVFSGKSSDEGTRISFSPEGLARVTLAMRNERNLINEKLKLGTDGWTSFEIGDRYIREITNHCYKGRIEDAFVLAKNIIESVVSNFGVEIKKNGN